MDTGISKSMVDFFEGTLSPEGERELFAYLAASAEHRAAFQERERLWTETHTPSQEALDGLAALKERARRQRRMTLVRRVTAVVSAAAAVVLAVFLLRTERVTDAPADGGDQILVAAAPGSHVRHELPDGTVVLVNAGSTLSYGPDFNRTERAVTLEGEAWFEVAADPGRPFVVSAGGCRFTVLGTKFDICAYRTDRDVQAALLEGSLRFDSSESSEIMVPGDLVSFDPATGQTRKEQVDVEQFRSWTRGAIKYDRIAFPALLGRLEREYDIRIRLRTADFDRRTLRVSFSHSDSVDTILTSLSGILPISITREGEDYVVDRRNP